MSACQRRPEDTVVIDVPAPRSEARERHFIDFTDRRFCRIGSWLDPNDLTGISHHGSPYRTIGRAYADGISGHEDTFVFVGIHRLIRSHISITLAVAVRVEDERCPTLRLHLIGRFLEHFSV